VVWEDEHEIGMVKDLKGRDGSWSTSKYNPGTSLRQENSRNIIWDSRKTYFSKINVYQHREERYK